AMADHLILLDQGQVLQAGTAEACYLRPVSLAAARILGPVEALPARVDGKAVETPLGRFVRPAGEADGWQLLVRPQDIRLTDTGIPAAVVARRFAGGGTAVMVEITGRDTVHRLTVNHAGPVPTIGQPVFLTLDAGRAVVVPA
ncbi:MAG: TOBE domain-containing protein, partial [Alphaproteobacteria bacterium]|nr:TOBE domain-containing protein [Alphaproteobacteria bacterium]